MEKKTKCKKNKNSKRSIKNNNKKIHKKNNNSSDAVIEML